MTEEELKLIDEMEEAVDRAGGWVKWPNKLDPEEERLFTAFRMYCLEHKLSLSKMTDEERRELLNKLRKELGIKKKD